MSLRSKIIAPVLHRFFVGWLLLTYHLSGLAQNDLKFQRITVDDGLSQSSISSIIQDRYGYLWISTLDGLNRFDGSNFLIYRNATDDPNSLPDNYITGLYLDKKENLWTVHRGHLALYDDSEGKFKSFKLPNENGGEKSVTIYDFDAINDSIIYLSSNSGVIKFNCQKGTFSASPLHKGLGSTINSHYHSKKTGEWAAGGNKIFRRLAHSLDWEVVYEHNSPVSLAVDEVYGKVYCLTKESFLSFDFLAEKFKVVEDYTGDDIFDNANFDLTCLSNGSIWVSKKTLYVYDSTGKKINSIYHVPNNDESISGNAISTIYQTKDDVIWIGTNGFGLNKYNPTLSAFRLLNNSSPSTLSLSGNFIRSIFTTDNQTILVGALTGVDIVDKSKNKVSHYDLRGKNGKQVYVNSFFQTKKNEIWLCTSKGLMLFDGTSFSLTGDSSLDSTDLFIYNHLFAANRHFLASNKGIYEWDPVKRKSEKVNPKGSPTIGFFNHSIWIETTYNLLVLDSTARSIVRTFPKKNNDKEAFPNVDVKCFHTDRRGNFWIGSWGGGLSLYHPKENTFTHFTESEGLPNSVVYGILEDSQGNLWLSTNKGLCVFDPVQLKVIRKYEKDDGVQGNEFNTGAYFKAPDGEFYFGGVNGLNIFNPAKVLAIKAEMPKAVLTDFYINNIKMDKNKYGTASDNNNQHYNLKWGERNFSFDIAGLGFGSPNRVKFKYLLENFDDSWNEIGNQRRISFTNIPPGSYVLHVKASNPLGDWEAGELTLSIHVDSPYWKDPWFIFMGIVFIIGVSYFAYEYRVRSLRMRNTFLAQLVENRTFEIQMKNEEIAAQNEELALQSEVLSSQNKILEEKVSERTLKLRLLNAELMERNNQLEQFTFITAHNIRGPVARIKGLLNLLTPNKTEEMKHLATSVNNLDEVITDLGKILNIKHEASRLFEKVELLTQLKKVLDVLDADIKKANAHIDISRFEQATISGVTAYVYSIFFNIIHNSLKYANPFRPLTIQCECRIDGNRVRLSFKDNGLGIDMKYAQGKIFNLYQRFHPEIKGKGMGLFLVKSQVEVMEGYIKVESELNMGTTFKMDFPLHLKKEIDTLNRQPSDVAL